MPVEIFTHNSKALRDNPLGDPYVRELHCIVPDGLSDNEPVGVLWYLSGYAGVSRGMLSGDPWQESLQARISRLQAEGLVGPMIVALPDCFTKYGGSQFLDSPAQGLYETYLLKELREFVESKFNVSGHAIAGKSSGGYGALFHAMRNPGQFRAAVCHSGDLGFRLAHTGELPLLMNAIHEHGGVENLVKAFDKAKKKKTGRWIGPMSMLAYAAAYSPDETQPLGIALPFDLSTGQIDEAVFARWLALDPVEMVTDKDCQESLRSLDLLFIDCGSRDEYHLQWGARGLKRKLDSLGIEHVYQEFNDGHRSTSYRLDVSLPLIYKALSK
ncbi:MAG: alpha/beta hydrolase-fold protein [Myxococcota bacterium]|nr:alpha/beta hydrolase-fold protein [Myxococcota bacterium]